MKEGNGILSRVSLREIILRVSEFHRNKAYPLQLFSVIIILYLYRLHVSLNSGFRVKRDLSRRIKSTRNEDDSQC